MQVATRHMRHSTSRQLLAQQLTHRVHKLKSDSKFVFFNDDYILLERIQSGPKQLRGWADTS